MAGPVADPLAGLVEPEQETLIDFLSFLSEPMPQQDPQDQVLPFPGFHALDVEKLNTSDAHSHTLQSQHLQTGRPSTTSEAAPDKKSLKLREKNRRAQQKFRERKKEQDRETAERIGELSAQLNAAESHKGMLQRSKWMLLAAVRSSEDVLESSPRFVPARGWQGYDTRSVLQLQEAWEAPMLLSPKRLVSLSHAEFTCLWQDLAAAMVLHLPAAQRDICSPSGIKLQALVNELSALAAFMALGNSEVLYSFIKAPANAGNLAIWAPVATSLAVNVNQKQQLLRWREAYLATSDKLQAARVSLLTALKSAMVHGIEIGPEPSTGYNLRQMVDQNTEDLQRVAFDFQSQCWMQGLTAVQTATCIVKAAPAAPDLPGIIGALQ